MVHQLLLELNTNGAGSSATQETLSASTRSITTIVSTNSSSVLSPSIVQTTSEIQPSHSSAFATTPVTTPLKSAASSSFVCPCATLANSAPAVIVSTITQTSFCSCVKDTQLAASLCPCKNGAVPNSDTLPLSQCPCLRRPPWTFFFIPRACFFLEIVNKMLVTFSCDW